MVDTTIFLKQLSIVCYLVVFSAVLMAGTALTLNVIVRVFLHLWKKLPGLGKTLDKLSRVSINQKVAPRKRRAPAKKSPARVQNVLLKPAPAKQGVGHV